MLADQAASMFSLDKVLFIPTGNPPHKDTSRVTATDHRIEMARLAIANNRLFEVSTFECDRPGASYTYLTLDALHAKYAADTQFFYIIGSDVLAYLTKFKNYRHLFESCTFIVSARPGKEHAYTAELTKELVKVHGADIKVMEFPQIGISSSLIRSKIAEGQCTRYMLPDSVISYIGENRLYTVSEQTALPNYWELMPETQANNQAVKRAETTDCGGAAAVADGGAAAAVGSGAAAVAVVGGREAVADGDAAAAVGSRVAAVGSRAAAADGDAAAAADGGVDVVGGRAAAASGGRAAAAVGSGAAAVADGGGIEIGCITDADRATSDKLRKQLWHIMKSRLGKKRFEHTVGVMKTAEDLAKRIGADPDKAAIAGLLHDCMRDVPPDELVRFCELNGLQLTEHERQSPIILHAWAGAVEARKLLVDTGSYFGDIGEIEEAIACHTTGRERMSLLAKIIYIADAIEPGRDFEAARTARMMLLNQGNGNELNVGQLDAVVLYLLERQIVHIVETGKALHYDTVFSRNWLLSD